MATDPEQVHAAEQEWENPDVLNQGLGFKEEPPKKKSHRLMLFVVGILVGFLVLVANVVSKVRNGPSQT